MSITLCLLGGGQIASHTTAAGGGGSQDPPPPAPHWSKRVKVAGEVSAAPPPLSFGSPGPRPYGKFPRPQAEAGGAGGRRGPGRVGAGSHWRAVRSVRGLPFKVTVLGLRLLWGGGGQGAGPALSRSSPAPFDAGWPPLLGFPPPVFFSSRSLFFPLTPADSFSRQRHNHGYLIRPYFLIAMGRWGEKQPGCRPRLAGEGKGGITPRVQTHFATSRRSWPPPPPPGTRAPLHPAAPTPNPSLPTTFVCLTLKH